MTRRQAPAGRLTMTQYPAEFMDQVGLFNPDLRLNEDGSTRGELTNGILAMPWFPFVMASTTQTSISSGRTTVACITKFQFTLLDIGAGSLIMAMRTADPWTTLSVCIKMSALAGLIMSGYFSSLQRMLALRLTLRSGSFRILAPITFRREDLRPLTCRWSWVGLLVLMRKVILSLALASINLLSTSTQQ